MAIQSGRMRWAEHVARIGEMKYEYKLLAGKRTWKRQSRDLGIDGRIILKCI
jgi:hypothetical protein